MVLTDAVLAVTYRCNARCKSCDVWKLPQGGEGELSPEEFELLPDTLRNINVSGGEPFMRPDLAEVVAAETVVRRGIDQYAIAPQLNVR